MFFHSFNVPITILGLLLIERTRFIHEIPAVQEGFVLVRSRKEKFGNVVKSIKAGQICHLSKTSRWRPNKIDCGCMIVCLSSLVSSGFHGIFIIAARGLIGCSMKLLNPHSPPPRCLNKLGPIIANLSPDPHLTISSASSTQYFLLN